MPPCNPESGLLEIQVPLDNLGDRESLDLFHGATVTGERLKKEHVRASQKVRRDKAITRSPAPRTLFRPLPCLVPIIGQGIHKIGTPGTRYRISYDHGLPPLCLCGRIMSTSAPRSYSILDLLRSELKGKLFNCQSTRQF